MQEQQGFTLIELVLVIIILALVAGLGGMVLACAFSSANKFNATNSPNYWEGAIAYERMVRDLREMVALIALDNSSIRYVDSNGNVVTYALSGSQLVRSGTVLANALTRLSFSYYDQEGKNANKLGETRCIHIAMVLMQAKQSGSTLQTLVCPRNL